MSSSLPEGYTVRPLRPQDAEAASAVVFDHGPYERWRERRLSAPDFDPSLWFLARDGDELAAVARCDRSRFGAGWVGALGVRKPWRRRRIGLALLRHVLAEFQRRGGTRVALGVDAQNPTGATRLYEQAGMHVAYEAAGYGKELR
jgi:mycothiol synthase